MTIAETYDDLEVIKRADAKALGQRLYFTGKECVNGHISQRNTGDGGCITCKAIRRASKASKDWNKKWYEENREGILKKRRKFKKENPEIIREQQREWYHRNSQIIKSRRLLLTDSPSRPMPDKCESCGCDKRPDRSLCIDHDHETGKFRGWLCDTCNTGIGKLGDSIEGLETAIAYLKKHYGDNQ